MKLLIEHKERKIQVKNKSFPFFAKKKIVTSGYRMNAYAVHIKK